MSLKIENNWTTNAVDLLNHLKWTRINLPTIKQVREESEKINWILKLGFEDTVWVSFYSVIFKLKITVDWILEWVEYLWKVDKDTLTEESKLNLKKETFDLGGYINGGVTEIIDIPEYSQEEIKWVQIQLPIDIEWKYHNSALWPYTELEIWGNKIDLYDPNF